MNAKDTIALVERGKAPQGWGTALGIYANLSKWPYEVKYYVKCPKCGQVHGDYATMREAHRKRLCATCDREAIDDIKDQVQKVIHEPEAKVKPMAKIIGEAEEFDPFDEPAAEMPADVPPEDLPTEEPTDPKGEIERLLLGNWVDIALREFCADEHYDLSDLEIDEHWGQGNYDPDDKESTTQFKVDVGNEEWLFFKSEDEAESYALDIVRTDLENEPEIFSQDWLRQHVDEDRLRNAIGDPYEEWEDEVRGLDYEELLNKMVEEGYVEDDDPVFFKKNGDQRIENPVRVKALDKIMEEYVEREKPKWEPWDWLEDVYGKEEAQKQAIEMVGIDVDAAAKDAVATDGWPHFVARYDGHSHTLENGAVYCRIN